MGAEGVLVKGCLVQSLCCFCCLPLLPGPDFSVVVRFQLAPGQPILNPKPKVGAWSLSALPSRGRFMGSYK